MRSVGVAFALVAAVSLGLASFSSQAEARGGSHHSSHNAHQRGHAVSAKKAKVRHAKQASRKQFSRKARVAKARSANRRVVASTRPNRTVSGTYSGMASWYASGTRTASGARFNPNGLTAAHRTLPFGTRLLVRHRTTGRTVQVTVNDRGPFIRGRVIDLSRGAAQQLGVISTGTAPVDLTVIR